MVRDEAISSLLGYVSICSWLGAQFPQLIVNWRRKNVDGLALPFLANWLLGDTTNLVGCILTDQLPFQTYLATYFVFVDICLVSQFAHYYVPRPTKSLSILSPSVQQSRTSLIQHSPEAHSFRRAHSSRSRSASHSLDPRRRSAMVNMTLTSTEVDLRNQDSLVAEVDAHGTQGHWRSRGSRRGSSLEGLPESVVADLRERDWGGRRLTSLERDAENEAAEEESESSPSVMIDSFYSEGGGRSRGRGKRVSWTRESPGKDASTRRAPLLDDTEPLSTSPSRMRGRQLTRPDVYTSPDTAETSHSEAQLPRVRRMSTASAVSAAASRRSASIIFLAAFALFSLSSYPGIRRSAGSEGQVLTMAPGSTVHKSHEPHDVPVSSLFTPPTPLSFVAAPDAVLRTYISADEGNQRLIGRVSAWSCTTLYLTSRLPQIWKNFARKSVEGLSMYLFIFAFLGNFFYVLSILTSPKMDLPAPLARQFIRDSVPYLLGSGGTLVFDITIVLQSFVYDPSRRVIRSRVRRKSLVAASEEEQRLLLSTDRRMEDAC